MAPKEHGPQNKIRELRETAGITIDQLGDQLGVTGRTIYRWEAGAVQIPDEQKIALANLFGVPVTYLMGWDQP